MTKKPKAETVTLTGVVERADVVTQAPYMPNRYCPGEQAEYRLDVALRLPDGSAAYLKSPAVRRTVASAPGVAIVHYWIDGEAKKGFREEGGRRVATPGEPNTNRLVPTVAVGDTVTVTGRVKARTVSKRGNPYVALTHVWKEPTPADRDREAAEAAYKVRAAAARATVPPTLPGDAVPPVIPGVTWAHIGGHPALCDPDGKETWYPSDWGNGHAWLRWESRVEDLDALIAHVEKS